MLKRWVGFISLITLLFGLSLQGWSQTTTARVSGTVTDDSGAVLPGSQITVKNVETGVPRTVVTDERGRYVVPQLPPGSYEISASMSGFETMIRKGITLAIGQEVTLNLAMRVGTVSEQVTVTADAPLVNTSGSAVSGVVEAKRIVDLPLNGRDFTQLALVEPGVLSARNTDSTASKGYGTRISVAGSRPDQTAWLLDGTNIKSSSNFGTPGSAAGVILGVDAVREFQVLTSNFSAEFGGNSGGVVNMVTKSGTNDFHGTAYEFLRNSSLDARNFFDRRKPAFKRNQFGFSLGGAIKKDKAFYFGNYEGLRQRLGLTSVAIVPDGNAHRGLIPGPGGVLEQLQVAPSIQPYLNLWPTPNGPPVLTGAGQPSGLGTLFAPASDSINENYFMTRVDYRFNDNQSIFTRFTYDNTSDSKPDTVPITSTDILTRPRYATVQYENILTPKFLSSTKLAFNRTALTADISLNTTYPSNLLFWNDHVPPQLNFSGVDTFGPDSRNQRADVQNIIQIGQGFTYTRGSHLFKFGTDIQLVHSNPDGGPRNNGSFTWNAMRDFLLDNPLINFTVQVPGSTSQRTFRQTVLGLYFQDDWKLLSNLTFNLGLRYETFTVPSEKWGRVAVVKDWVTATKFDTNVPFWNNPSKKNFSPRVGFAWDPQGNGKTAIRGGFGLFFVDLLSSYFKTPAYRNPPIAASLNIPLGNLGSARSDVARVGPTVLTADMTPNSYMEIFQYNLDPTYEVKFNFTVERELPGNVAVVLGYLGGRGTHLWEFQSANAAPSVMVNGRAFVPRGATRINPKTGVGSIRYTDAKSFYNGLQFEVKKHFGRGFQFQSSYTWSKNVDDSATGIALTDVNEGEGSQPYDHKADRGLSGLNVSHNFVLNGIYAIPFSARSGIASNLLGGWQVSGIFSASSGVPFGVYSSGRFAPNLSYQSARQHPEFVAGKTTKGAVIGDPNRYFDSSIFTLPAAGFYGNAGRNILIGPGLSNFDFSLLKSTALGFREGARLEFRADVFNIFNRANFRVPSSLQVVNSSNGAAIAGAGRITSTITTARQMQFSLKLLF